MDAHNISQIATLIVVFVSAILGGLLARQLKLPALLGYICSGVFFGNILSPYIDTTLVHLISDVGVTLLLFTIGVEFSFQRLRKVLGYALWPALIQILVTIGLILALFWGLRFGFFPSLYFAIAAALSSTAIIVKVLSERSELETTAGELTTAWLILQDLAVIPIMILLPALVQAQSAGPVSFVGLVGVFGETLMKSLLALGVIFFLGRRGIPKVLNFVSSVNNREIFLLSVIGIVFLCAVVTYGIGLSAAVGAFLAGLLISETSQNHAIFAEIRPLRDVFAVVFFISLGMILPFSRVISIGPTLVFAALCIMAVKLALIYVLARYLGNHKKVAFLTAISLTQMSEFGFILAKEGQQNGVLSSDLYIFLIALTFVTMLIGTTALSNGHALYYWFLRVFGSNRAGQRPQAKRPEREADIPMQNHIVICGYGRVGKYIGRALDMCRVPYTVVDVNQATVATLRSKSISVVFGDPAEKDVLDYAQVDYAKAIIIAIPDRHTQEMIISNALTLNRNIRIICRSHYEEDQRYLKSLGVQTIVQPEFEAAISVVERLLPSYGVTPNDISGKISRLKIEHGLG